VTKENENRQSEGAPLGAHEEPTDGNHLPLGLLLLGLFGVGAWVKRDERRTSEGDNASRPLTPRSDAPRSRSQRELDEYKSLRDEMLQHGNRVYVILAAEFAAVATLAWRGMAGATEHRVWLMLISQCFVVVGLWLTLLAYQHLYIAGSYLCVFHEIDTPGWHLRRRDSVWRTLRKTTYWFERLHEPRAIGCAYAMLMLVNVAIGFQAIGTIELVLPSQSDFVLTFQAFSLAGITIVAFLAVCALDRSYHWTAKRLLIDWMRYRNVHGDDTAQAILRRLLPHDDRAGP
jgi:hypothetical protein